ncbi:MAG: Cupin 2 barrel domain-containing protein [Bacteroidetes bacterium]|nr:MAG: Cupin 2 barrel domain-containing protein [Bacteroidota bacterium]
MERRNFLMTTSLFAAFSALSPLAIGATHETPDSDPLKPVLLPGTTPLDHKGGMDIRVWMRSSMTNGLFSSVECAVAPKRMGPAPHHHLELDEIMYVVEGTASVLVGDEIVEVNAGGWHLRPRLITHTFWNASEKPLRFIDMYFNQPFEEYLEAVFHELTPENGYANGSEKKNKEISALAERFGLVHLPDAWEKRNEIAAKYGLK